MIPWYRLGQDPSAARGAETIAILGLEVVGAIDEESVRAARDLTTALRARAASGPYAIAPNSEKELIDEKLMHDCPDERRECMAKIARALGAAQLLYGRVERRSRGRTGGYQATLRLLNVERGQVATAADFIPNAEASGEPLAARARSLYEQLLASARPRRAGPAAADGVLVRATNEAFWQLTKYKPGKRLDMSDPQDRAMSKTWMDIYREVQGHRDRAAQLAQRVVNETVSPYVLVVEQRDGTLRSQTFERRGNLDVQYEWLVDQPDYYTYAAMFDFTQNRAAPILDQFSISKRQQMATSGWHGW